MSKLRKPAGKFCKTIPHLVDALAAHSDARLKLPGYGTLHVSHSFRTGVFRGKVWRTIVANARLTKSRGVRDDVGQMGVKA